ncbi:AAA family ATPase [Janibacter indicus]|uniref:AAA family ATPase n=1 Tax=Janibacter indicus TaxID=857417 RepID=A0A7L9IVI3_9MICO|nr:AAA family ATPase [Janibacter indicus]QOK21391.1 AAA family ATPase [Janibacter indicus]
MTSLDLEHARDFLTRLYGDAPGRLSIVHMDAAGTFHGTGGDVPDIDAALERIARLDANGARGIYHRTTTLTRQLQHHERGAASDSHALPGLWADVDFGTEGHKPGPGLALPADEPTARRIVTESGLPAPSLWVHSGGGYYPWWLLEQPLTLDDSTRTTLAEASKAWQQILKRSADRLRVNYGAGIGDLARVLRVPGTVNRKTSSPRPCRTVEDTGTVYTLDELLAAIVANPAPAPAAPAPRRTPRHDVLGLDTGDSAFDLLDEHVTFDDILTSAGWTRHTASHSPSIHECWTRPDGPDNPCSAHTLTANPHVLVVHSELAGLPTGGGQRLTRGRVFAHLHHRGDERAGALDLFDAINGRPCTPAAAALPLPRRTMPAPTSYNMGDLGEHDVTTQARREQAEHEEQRPAAPSGKDSGGWSPPDPTHDFERAVAERLHYLRVVDTAQQRHAELKRGDRPTTYARDGADFLLDDNPDEIPALWGHGTDILCAKGEPLMICGGPGVGKTTIAGQLLEARLGLGPRTVLDLPVEPTSSRVLYLAMDRPRQIQRALARLLRHEEHRDTLHERLIIWPGPPPADLAQDTDALARLAHEHGADTVFVDSLKDAFLGVSEDGPAAGYNRARQTAIAAGVELIELHHTRKNTASNGAKKPPATLSDVYGSTWLTSGAGSVISLDGDAGDAVVELRHLKQPADTIGPLKVLHDSTTGRSSIFHATDLIALARGNGDITAREAAKALSETDKPTANQVEKARRRLQALEKSGQLFIYDTGNKAKGAPTRWQVVDRFQTFTPPFTAHEGPDTITEAS